MSIFDRASNSSYWRGFNYYENNHVFDIKHIDDDIYSAVVKGTEDYDVVVDLKHPLKSTCTCPFTKGNHKMCKHMIALAFSVCQEEVLRAKKIRDDYFDEQERKERETDSLMKKKEKEIRAFVNRLTEEEVRERLFITLMNEEYDSVYKSVYGYDDDPYSEFD